MATSPTAYAELGWRVFPCHNMVRGKCSCGKGDDCSSRGKHPRTSRGVKDATTDPQKIAAWMRAYPDANWAVACGRESGFFVVDVDPRHGGFESMEAYEANHEVPHTLTSLTGGGGRHLFYAYPAGQAVGNRTNWLAGVDIKSDGGYVILAPSNHESGGTYRWRDWTDDALPELAEAPAALVLSVTQRSETGDSEYQVVDTDLLLDGVSEGSRDETIFRWACSYRRKNGDNAKNAALLLARAAAENCTPPFPPEEAVKCVESAWRQDHSDGERPFRLLGTGGGGVHPLTDQGNALRLIDEYGSAIRYVPGWGWIHWDNGRWENDKSNHIAQLCQTIPAVIHREALAMGDDDRRARNRHVAWGVKSQSAGALSAMERVAQSRPEVVAAVEDFDADDMIIACRNGVIDLRTGVLREATRDDLVTKNTDVIYDPDADLSRWLTFLNEALEGDQTLIEYVQRAAGYSLTGSTQEESFFIISGPPASGKSTFLDALASAMGTYATATQSDTFMYRRNQQPAKDELARLAGHRLLTMSEIREGESFSEALIKQFTGGDMVTARHLYEKAFEFRPQFKLWVGTNHDPAAKDDALWRRIKKIPFPITVPPEKRDAGLKVYLRDSEQGAAAVLAWAVKGAMMWFEDGLKEPQRIVNEIAEYRQAQDRDGAFITEVLNVGVNSTILVNDVYVAYKRWSDKYGERAKAPAVFMDMLKRKGYPIMSDSGKFYVSGVSVKAEMVSMDGIEWV